MKRTALFFCLVILSISNLFSQQIESLQLSGPYFGQKPPGNIPIIFAPDILPSAIFHTTPVFTADGKEVYWKILGAKTISMMKQKNNVWTIPEEIKLSSELNDFWNRCSNNFKQFKKLFVSLEST